MTIMRKDGGPAFPTIEHHPESSFGKEMWGMSLRDWFAGEALAGGAIVGAPADTARKCFAIADAMLAERQKL